MREKPCNAQTRGDGDHGSDPCTHGAAWNRKDFWLKILDLGDTELTEDTSSQSACTGAERAPVQGDPRADGTSPRSTPGC